IPYTPWQLLEHMRIAQWDILEFSRNANHVSPKWPEGYWPAGEMVADAASWQRSIEAFRADLKAMENLLEDSATRLFTPIAHGDGQTILREALLVADHNAYHLGVLSTLKRILTATASDE
ncbi:MAG TPA: DinB family protein, partial [Pyrinomonadaceae bacterium]|nr:DinB family protein [Pyrinomonadaceae bacterium]